ncbi:MAG: crossover junction endodeoxyribonuclease RuvC [Bdellovibrionales bacterium]
MIILGIDPGLRKTGWGIIEKNGSRLSFVGSGLIKTQSSETLPHRLTVLHEGLSEIIRQWTPDEAAMEETFVNRNPQDALKLGQARGALLAVPARHGLECAEYATNKIKKSVVGVGHANKDQIGLMVKTLLPTCGKISEDEADALAVAITHAHYSGINKQIMNMVSA